MTEAPPIEWEDLTIYCDCRTEIDDRGFTQTIPSTVRQFKGGGPPLACPDCKRAVTHYTIKPVPAG
jgi:hypothetical protein